MASKLASAFRPSASARAAWMRLGLKADASFDAILRDYVRDYVRENAQAVTLALKG